MIHSIVNKYVSLIIDKCVSMFYSNSYFREILGQQIVTIYLKKFKEIILFR